MLIRRWVEMHAEDAFFQQALWLKNELDRLRHGAE
jgi:thiaminase/transcriptional activator TenA